MQIASGVVRKRRKKGVKGYGVSISFAVDGVTTGDDQLRNAFLLLSRHEHLALSVESAGESLRQRRLVRLIVARRQRDRKGMESHYSFQRNTAGDLIE